MKLAFSTLGCPGAPLTSVAAWATERGCTGVELRCHEGEPVAPPGSGGRHRAVADVARLRDAGIVPISLASYVHVAAPDTNPVDDAVRHVDLAAELGVPAVRVFGRRDPAGHPQDHDAAVATLRAAASRIAGSGVSVLLETHDCFRTGAQVAAVLADVADAQVGAVWDVLGPWRAGEDPADTAAALLPHPGYVQLKDVRTTEDLRPVMPGDGAIPLRRVLDVLGHHGYRGWLSLEWERAWFPDVPSIDVALAAFTRLVRS
jgi:sugar phosphate isomerase/epimerase